MAGRRRRLEAERLAGGDPELVGHEVAPSDELRDRMLDLEARVHLEEGGLAPVVDEELARAGAHVADRAREGQRRLAQAAPEARPDRGRGSLLEDLLVSTLDRTVAFAELDARPVGIEQHLDLDVAAALDQPFEDEPVVAEGGSRLSPGRREGVGEAVRLADRAHPLATATGRRLDQERVADAGGGVRQRVVRLVVPVVAGDDRDAQRRCESACRGLVAHRSDRGRWRTDPADPGGQHGLREFGVLGQEAEPRVERVGTDGPCGRDDRADVEQVECVGTVGPRKDRADAEPVAGPGDPVRDLAAVGDEEGPDRHDGERLGPLRCDKRVNRVRRDTPTAANTTCGQPTRRDPALNRPCRRPDTRGSLTRAQFLGHDCRDRRIDGSMSSDDAWPAAVACGGGLWRSCRLWVDNHGSKRP